MGIRCLDEVEILEKQYDETNKKDQLGDEQVKACVCEYIYILSMFRDMCDEEAK